MTSSEFIEANNRLETYYEKEYTAEQTKIMYEELKNLSIDRYRKVIAQCIRSCKFLPKVADIIKANMEIIEHGNPQENREKFQCNKCEGTGYVFFTKVNKEGNKLIQYTYVARCACKNAENTNRKVATYKELGIEIGNRENQVKDTIRNIEEIKRKLLSNMTTK